MATLSQTFMASGDVVTTSDVSAADVTSERFQVKADMALWVDVNYSNPTAARQVAVDGDTIDSDDAASVAIMQLLPELEYVGNTPA